MSICQVTDNQEVLEVDGNLLQITTIPISIEIKVTNAKYEYPDAV